MNRKELTKTFIIYDEFKKPESLPYSPNQFMFFPYICMSSSLVRLHVVYTLVKRSLRVTHNLMVGKAAALTLKLLQFIPKSHQI